MNEMPIIPAISYPFGYYILLPDGTATSTDHDAGVPLVIREWFIAQGNPKGVALIDWR